MERFMHSGQHHSILSNARVVFEARWLEEEKNILSTLRAEEFEDVKKATERYFDKLDFGFLIFIVPVCWLT
jgi:hypothetical protein